MNFLISKKHLRKCSHKQHHIVYVIELWLIGGLIGAACVLLPIYLKSPDAITTLIRALTP